jgi:hypothetical protein
MEHRCQRCSQLFRNIGVLTIPYHVASHVDRVVYGVPRRRLGWVRPSSPVSLQKLYRIDDMFLSRSRVADTIRNKIINVSVYEDDPAVLMLGMVCALVGSSLWLSFATKMGMPVSTT